jgi:hypothetical protein
MEREDRHLDGECERKGGEQPRRLGCQEILVSEDVVVREGVGAGRTADDPHGRDDRHQHEQRSEEGVNEELLRGVQAVAAAPDADDEVHRDQSTSQKQ